MTHPDEDILQRPIVPTDLLEANKTFIDHERRDSQSVERHSQLQIDLINWGLLSYRACM